MPEPTLRVVVVDDEAPARALLREYLTAHADVEIVAECANGYEAVKRVGELEPDLVFLDVQMPKLDGFEVLELLGSGPAVVFCTAFDEYALRAFEVHAVDYLLKPFGRDRLAEALARVRERLVTRRATPPVHRDAAGSESATGAASLSASARPPGQWATRLVVKDGAEVHVIPVDQLDRAEAQDDYVALHVGARSHLKAQTLADLAAQLDPGRFVRVHRSHLLALDRIARLELYAKDSRVAVLRDGTEIPVSRSGHERLKQLL